MDPQLERIKRIRATMNSSGSSGNLRFRGIYHTWRSENVIRLVGECLETRTHFIAASTKSGSRGLCTADAFVDKKLRSIINCFDWDVAHEQPTAVKTCPICRLNAIANALTRKNSTQQLTEEERKFFKNLGSNTYPRRSFKWNIIDRLDPLIIQLVDDTEQQVKGLKIVTMGSETFRDVSGIFDQCQFNIASPEEGIDIKVTKSSNKGKESYSATAVLEGRNLKVTPLTPEERGWKVHDLKAICGWQSCKPEDVVNFLHPDLRELLAMDLADASSEAKADGPSDEEKDAIDKALSEDEENVSAPAAPAPAAPSKPATSISSDAVRSVLANAKKK